MPKLWRESLGERGCRVMLFERTPGGPIYREVWVNGERIAAQRSMGHRDREQAKAEAFTLLASLKARHESLASGHVTLATLFDKYDGITSIPCEEGEDPGGGSPETRMGDEVYRPRSGRDDD